MQFSGIKINAFDFPAVPKYTDAVLWDKTKQASDLKVLPNQL